MGAAASIRMVYKDAMNWFRTYIDGDTYIADFAAIDKDGDNTLSYMEVRRWIEMKAKDDPNWNVFLAEGAPIIAVAHKMASMRTGPHSHVIAPKVVDVNDFKTLLIQMFAIAILWSHFDNADQWKDGEDPGSKELSFDAFRLAVRTLTMANAKEELSDEGLQADFDVIDTNSSGTIGFHEVCNFCCKFIDDPQTIEKKIDDAEKRRLSVSQVTIPKFFGEHIGDGAKVGIVNEINQKKHKGPKAYTEGLTVDDKNKEALSMLASKIERQASTARKVASEEKALIIKKRFSTIESFVENNLCCGYLLKFCQREFTAENLLFIMEVDDYRDFYVGDIKKSIDADGNATTSTCWVNKWQDTDTTVNIDQPPDPSLLDSDYWPSTTDKTQAKNVCDALYTNFLSNDSQVQVCISESFMEKTLRRMKLLHLYGPQVFEEAVIDPIKTMKKDVLPRFVVSDIYLELINNLALCEPLPLENQLEVVPPSNDEAMKNGSGGETAEGGKPFSAADADKKKAPADVQLTDIIHSKSFYTAFEKFLIEKDKDTPVAGASSGNTTARASRGSFGNNNSIKSYRLIQHLYCLRLIARIEGETAIATNPATSNVDKIVAASEAVAEAWDLYKFYVAPGSCYEFTGLPHGERKKFMLEVARPTIDNKAMATMKRSATTHLLPLFNAFRVLDEFKACCKSVLGAVP